jgi:hypothetical protein
MNNTEISSNIRFFVSFSGKDKAAAREIMNGLRSQNFDLWDYSNEIEAMSFSQEVKTRLLEEIDRCDYFIALVSKDSTHETTGYFTRFEVEYATAGRKLHLEGRIIIIELEDVKRSDYIGPFEKLKEYLHIDFLWNSNYGKNIRSYISIMEKICQITGRRYIPQITPHARLPFWEKFRDEVISFVQSNTKHVHLNGILGEFNEYYKMKDYQNAYIAIQSFIISCNDLFPECKMVYPWIVKAVTEQSLGLNSDAQKSYQSALNSEPCNPDAYEGLGMVLQITGENAESVYYLQEALKHSTNKQTISETLKYLKGGNVFFDHEIKENNKQINDIVECTVFSPFKVERGESFLVQVISHLIEKQDEAEKMAREFDENAVRRGYTSLETEIERGSKLTFELSISGINIEDPVQSTVWRGKTIPVSFEVQIPDFFSMYNIVGKVIISQNNIPIGHIRFKVDIVGNRQESHNEKRLIPTGDAKAYRYAFISYASKDREEVLRRIQMLSTLKIEYFQDIMKLEPGDKWATKIYESIDKADVFFLFWSKAASESEWVLNEIRYAMNRKKGSLEDLPEILPVIIEGPPISKPPDELKDIHFNDRIIYFIGKQ